MACSSLRLLITILLLLVFLAPIETDNRGKASRGRSKGRGPRWWSVVDSEEPSNLVLESHHNAISSGDTNVPLRRKQERLVQENPGVLLAISKGLKMALHECCRETAFVYAITSAGVTHAVSRACSEGLMETCTCDYRHRGPTGADWEWGGCNDNVDFGYKFARAFVDAAERGRDLRYIMNLHNNEAGRMHVSAEMRRECKCHGMSGSCTVKTCWMRLPLFRDVGNNLKDRFDGASRVLVSNQGNFRRYKRKYRFQLKPYNPEHKLPSRKDLVYFEASPDFCVPNPKLGIVGTKGRTCNDTSIGVDGCDLMCCNRGYVTEVREDFQRCACTFHWCCQVKCKICKVKKTVHTCS
ncbi:protein Wnt-1-like [Centruroides sculpturatus]|uniref:protein Wnt-1-like n=1 Tax=Centruroides sculpturatus TaxID=218467 RepID=UPI000C6D65BD|nr:protein Wnt-1-like [Centruroides sculpturatus]